MFKIFALLNNWKTILGYILMTFPGLTEYPMLRSAAEALKDNPNAQNIVNFVAQLLLATGVLHRVFKNFKKI